MNEGFGRTMNEDVALHVYVLTCGLLLYLSLAITIQRFQTAVGKSITEFIPEGTLAEATLQAPIREGHHIQNQ